MDIYNDIVTIAQRIKALGFIDQHDGLIDSLQEGSTGTEILMISRYKLRNLIAEEEIPDDNLMRDIGILIARIDFLLM